MSKFCRIFESEGEQLLVVLAPSEEDPALADILEMFEVEGAVVKLTLGGLDWESAEKYLEDYSRKQALKILKDPFKFVKGLLV